MPTDPLRIVLLEPFLKGSHAAWAGAYAERSRHRVRLESLPGVHWKWRMSHSALTFARRLADLEERPDLILATSMVDGAALRGLLPPALARLPLAVMFHENQLTYPLPPGESRDLHYAWTHVTTCLAADLVLFNSPFHRRDFLQALPPFLALFPDHAPTYAAELIENKSRTAPPGVDRSRFLAARERARNRRQGPLRILWNHRWEADKDPDLFLQTVADLAARGERFELVLAGPGAQEPPLRLEGLLADLAPVTAWRGCAPAGELADLVASCDLVVSTALHDFYGVAVTEAMTAGLCPLLPHRQNYPWLVPEHLHRHCLYGDRRDLCERLLGYIREPEKARERGETLPPTLAGHDLRATTAVLDDLLAELAAERSGRDAAG